MQADVVIGADGASSRVRHWLTETRPAYTGITFLEGWIDEPLRPQAELVGRGTLFSFGGTEAIVAQRNGGGRICVYAAVRRSREWLRQEIASAGAVALVRCLYQSWAPGLRTLLMACEDFTERPIYSLPQDFSWPPPQGDHAHRRCGAPHAASRGGCESRHARCG